MNANDTLSTLQLLHAGLLAESVSIFHQYGILEMAARQKLRDDTISAPARNEQLAMKTVEDIFNTHRELFGFSDWTVERNRQSIVVSNTRCKLCAIAKAMGTVQPCEICCINPLNSLCGALEQSHSLTVETTLWDSDHCCFKIHLKQSP